MNMEQAIKEVEAEDRRKAIVKELLTRQPRPTKFSERTAERNNLPSAAFFMGRTIGQSQGCASMRPCGWSFLTTTPPRENQPLRSHEENELSPP